MATVTGITAAKADAILGQSVTGGTINGSGHLILSRANGSTIDAGDFTAIVTAILNSTVVAAVNTAVPNAVAGFNLDLGSKSGAITLPGMNNVNLINALVEMIATGNLTLAVSDFPTGCKPNTQFAMRIQQDATGSRTLTLTGFKKSQGVLTLTTTANAVDILMFFYDGTNWNAGLMGVDFK